MIKEKAKNFKLSNEQKIEFGKLAINQLSNDNPRFPANLAVDEIGETNIIFSNYSQSVKTESTLVFLFDYYGMDMFCYLNGKPNGNYSDVLRPLYLDYMCQTFGEPFREKALAYWQKRAAEEYSEYQKRKAQELAQLNAKLDQEEKAIIAKRDRIFDTLSGKANQKLAHFAAPQITPKTNATAEQNREQ